MQPEIRRRSNGTIDIECYRSVAERMRREASIDIMGKAAPTIGMLVACGAALFAVVLFGGYQYSGPHQGRTTTLAAQAVHAQ